MFAVIFNSSSWIRTYELEIISLFVLPAVPPLMGDRGKLTNLLHCGINDVYKKKFYSTGPMQHAATKVLGNLLQLLFDDGTL
jgi:hypothetical protein